ncbi:UNVERIFIED_CONTAM: cellulose biosynthesis protein BcsQ [Acetivibrio alkalicellulosi]
MSDNRIFAVWGSPSSGKTVTSIKIALELSFIKKNVIVVLCDTVSPDLIAVLPNCNTYDKSLGSVLSEALNTQEQILQKSVVLKHNPNISVLGYLHGENVFTYPQYSKERAVDFLILLSHLADYVIVDCSSVFTSDILSTVALEMADQVLRLGRANLKSISYFESYLPVLADRRFNTNKHIKILSNVKNNEAHEKVKEVFGGVSSIIPYTEEIEEQYLSGELFHQLKSKGSNQYKQIIKLLVSSLIEKDTTNTKKPNIFESFISRMGGKKM